MVDIAAQKDTRGISINEVGVMGVKLPIKVLDKSPKRDFQYTIGTFNAFVDLPETQHGTHMSRIVEVIYNNRDNISAQGLSTLTEELVNRLKATSSRVQVEFPYFVDKYSPVSKLHNLMTYNARFDMRCDTPLLETLGHNFQTNYRFQLGVDVDVMTVCPCALEECQTGASHVQRGQVKIDIKIKEAAMVWLEELIEIAENAGSSPVYERLKRPDEKQVVLNGFKKPQFVEDVVRDAAVALQVNPNIDGYNISCENFESIHQHSAYARRFKNW